MLPSLTAGVANMVQCGSEEDIDLGASREQSRTRIFNTACDPLSEISRDGRAEFAETQRVRYSSRSFVRSARAGPSRRNRPLHVTNPAGVQLHICRSQIDVNKKNLILPSRSLPLGWPRP